MHMEIEPLHHSHPAWLLQEQFTFLRSLNEEETGFGQIFQVRRRETGETCALKIVKPAHEHAELALQMLVREARILAEVHHGHLVRLLEDHSDGGHVLPHLLLEYVPGKSLDGFLKTRRSLRTRLRLSLGVTAAIAYLAEQGWQHNDTHPRNVVVDERAEWPVLIDFGLATKNDDPVDPALLQHGFPGYTHPDILQGKPYTRTTQCFALARTVAKILEDETLDPAVCGAAGEELQAALHQLEHGECDELRPLLTAVQRCLLCNLTCESNW